MLSVFALEILACISNLKLKFNKYLYFTPDFHATSVQWGSSSLILTPTKYGWVGAGVCPARTFTAALTLLSLAGGTPDLPPGIIYLLSLEPHCNSL